MMRIISSKSAGSGLEGKLVAVICFVTLATGCGDGRPPRLEAAPTPPTAVVDSVLPIEEEVRRFADAAGSAPSSFTSEWKSVEELAEAFVDALITEDTAVLRAAMVTPAEYIAFYFPHSVYMRPPYQLDPAIVWFQMINGSDRGLTRALSRFGGKYLEMTGYTCFAPSVEGPNTLWESCRVRLRQGDEGEVEMRLFGPVLERDGHVKFLGYGNDL
jgi:hypothetical protein